jgi:hypothetical protein
MQCPINHIGWFDKSVNGHFMVGEFFGFSKIVFLSEFEFKQLNVFYI